MGMTCDDLAGQQRATEGSVRPIASLEIQAVRTQRGETYRPDKLLSRNVPHYLQSVLTFIFLL